MTVDELQAFIAKVYICGARGGKSMDLVSFWSAVCGCAFFKNNVPKQIPRNHAIPAFQQKGEQTDIKMDDASPPPLTVQK